MDAIKSGRGRRILWHAVVFLVIAVSLLSCNKVELNQSGIDFKLIRREANHVWADNLKATVVTAEIDGKVYSGFQKDPLKKSDSVRVQEYTLGFSTCNVDLDSISAVYPDIKVKYNLPFYNPLYESPYMLLSQRVENRMAEEPDVEFERKLVLMLNYKSASDKQTKIKQTRAMICLVDYRITPLRGLTITCSDDLCGIPAGMSLNNLFEVFSYPIYHNFIITESKGIIESGITNISIAKYLAFRPMVPAAMYLKVKQGVTIDKPKTVQFTINLELDEGRMISATAKNITLTP